MSSELAALAILTGVHLAAFGVFVALLFRADGGEDDVGGDDGGSALPPPRHPSGPSGDGLPLPDALPARVRLREPARLGELLPPGERRPAHPRRPGTPVPTPGSPSRAGGPGSPA